MIGSVRQISPCEASSVTQGTKAEKCQICVQTGFQRWGRDVPQKTNPGKGRKNEVGV